VSSEDFDSLYQPLYRVYSQSYLHSPIHGVYSILHIWNSIQINSATLSLANVSTQHYPRPTSITYYDIGSALAILGFFPIVFSVLPDVQSILEEKDSKVIALAILMGCQESAYWLVSFIVQFILTLPAYVIFCGFLCYWFGMVGISFSLILLIALFFIISHILMVLFLLTFMRKATHGRALTVILLVFCIFFTNVHQAFTLDPDNSDKIVKHVTSLIPLSAFQLSVMSFYGQKRDNDIPVTWKHFNADLIYNPSTGFFWLLGDCFIYLILFLFFNAINSRDFGSPPMTISDIFSKSVWKKVFQSTRSQGK
jgi:hypothetical protein